MGIDPLDLALARLVSNEQATEELPDIAADALVRGVDTPSLRALAGISRADVADARELFLRVIGELGLRMPTEEQALRTLAHQCADDMLHGRLQPIEGASYIWWRVANRLDKPGDLIAFVGLASEWEEHPDHREELESLILAEAQRLLR